VSLLGGPDLQRLNSRMPNGLRDPIREILVDSGPHSELPSLDLSRFNTTEMSRDILDVSLSSLVIEDLLPQRTGLLKVELRDPRQVRESAPYELLVVLGIIDWLLVRQWLDRALVVGPVALAFESHETTALEVSNRADGCVDGELVVVHAQPVTVSIRVREKPALKHWIGTGLDTGDQV